MTRRHPAWLALSLACLLAAPAGARPFDERTHAPTGLMYDLLTPAGWSAGASVPLFVCLHGAGDTKNNFRSYVEGMVAPLRDHLRIYVDSPSRQGWPGDCDGKILQLVRDLQRELRPKRIYGLGFSAGGYLTTSTAFPNPDLYAGAVIAGATFRTAPPADGAARRGHWYWSLGENDGNVKASGGIEGVRQALATAKYDAAHAVVEVVPGLGHALDGKSMTTAVEWVVRQADADDRMTAEDKALADSVAAPLKAGDAAAIRAVADRILATHRTEALHYLWGKLKALPMHAEPALSALGVELAGQLRDPRAVKELERLLPKVGTDAARALAVIAALGKLGEAAVKPLAKLVSKWELDGRPQVAAAQALGAIGSRLAAPALVEALKDAEPKAERAPLAAACTSALAAIAGERLEGAKAWAAWLQRQGR
jgi:poly(3-hydroxybutyrate) depolymerase